MLETRNRSRSSGEGQAAVVTAKAVAMESLAALSALPPHCGSSAWLASCPRTALKSLFLISWLILLLYINWLSCHQLHADLTGRTLSLSLLLSLMYCFSVSLLIRSLPCQHFFLRMRGIAVGTLCFSRGQASQNFGVDAVVAGLVTARLHNVTAGSRVCRK